MLICEYCLAGKMTRKPFGKGTRVEFPFQLIHSDDNTCHGYVYLIFYKSEY